MWVSAEANPFTCVRHDGGDGRQLDSGVVVGVEAVVEPYEALGRALGHAVVAGDDDVDAAPEAGPLQLWHQQADVVVNLTERRRIKMTIREEKGAL